MIRSIWRGFAAAAVVAAFASACGGGSSSTPTTPTATTPPAATTPPPATTPPATTPPATTTPTATATITIGTNGAISPTSVTVTRGGRVTFVNNDTRAHDMSSDPHPEHSDCPELNQIGFLTGGQSRTSGNLNTTRTCRFHDHNLPNDSGLKGTIVIQ